MKKLLISVLFLFVMVSFPIRAQETTVYLPLILKEDETTDMGYWSIVTPENTQNMVLNPSAETTGNFAAQGAATVTRVTTYQKYGLYSYRVQTSANAQGIRLTLSALSNAIHYATVLIRGTLPTNTVWSLNASNYTAPTLIESIDENWNLYGLQFPAVQANGSTTLYILQNGTGSGDFYIDGIQVEEKEYWTTYCDGSQDGCYWNGAYNASSSTRSELSRAGGKVYDLEDDYDFEITQILGLGANPTKLNTDSYATLPGGELNSIDSPERVFTLVGYLIEDDSESVNTKRDNLYSVLNPNDFNNQPVTLRYTGGTVQKEIRAHYESGLEGNLDAPGCNEKIPLRFIATDPFLYEIGNTAALLNTRDSATFTTIAGRLKSTGQWSNLGPPNAAGTYSVVYSIAEDETYLYIGGIFANWDNIANADNIVRYNKQTGVYSAMGTGANGAVTSIKIDPAGNVYAGGVYSSMGGVANTSRIAVWNGSSWSAVGTGTNDTIWDMVFDSNGILYVTGEFTTAGGGAANYIAKWNGSAWSALGTGLGGAIPFGVALASDMTNIYVGGTFDSANGVTVSNIAMWNGTTFEDMGGGANASVQSIAVSPDRTVYAGGNFTSIGSSSANYIAMWNGSTWFGLGTGVNDSVYSVEVGLDNTVYASGIFTSAGGITLADRIASWNGSSWSHLDINLPGAATVWAFVTSKYFNPVTLQYDLYLGFDTDGTGYYGDIQTVSNTGVANYPKLYFKRAGGTSATIEFVKNESTNKELLFNYSLRNNETLTIELQPTKKYIFSDYYGSRPDAILANSDFGQWNLKPGNNIITTFVNTAGSPTITAWLEWRKAYSGL